MSARVTFNGERMTKDAAAEATRELYRKFMQAKAELDKAKAFWRMRAEKDAPNGKLEVPGVTVGMPEASTEIVAGHELETAVAVEAVGGGEFIQVRAAGLRMLSDADRERLTVVTYGTRRVSIKP